MIKIEFERGVYFVLDTINVEKEILMRNLRNKLDMKLFNLLKFDSKYYFYGNKEN